MATELPKHVHKPEDYAALDGKDLPPEMVDDILTRAETGQPLTEEQEIALGSRPSGGGSFLLPKSAEKMTEAQLDAMLGGKEERERKMRWFTQKMLPLTIEALKKSIAEGKRYKPDRYGRRISLRLLLTVAEKELRLLNTTSLNRREIQDIVVQTKVRPIHLLPRFSEPELLGPHQIFFLPFCFFRQKDGIVSFHRMNKRWQRMVDDQFVDAPPPEPEKSKYGRKKRNEDERKTGQKRP